MYKTKGEYCMHTDKHGTPRNGGEHNFQKDSLLFGSVPSWEIHISQSAKELMIYTMEYHPGLLHLSSEDLIAILQRIEPDIHIIRPRDTQRWKKERPIKHAFRNRYAIS